MKRFLAATLSLILMLFAWGPQVVVADSVCTPTGFFRDGINMTAALINPGKVSGEVDATGCNIGVYYDAGSGKVVKADVHGSNYFGILVNGDVNTVRVDVTKSSVHNIGEAPFNGTQHGVAIYYRALGSGEASGSVTRNEVSLYQKGGIVVNGPGAKVEVEDNEVTGLGPVDFIAQNGIQVGFGASARGAIEDNWVSGNSYTGGNYASSAGILVVGGPCYGPPNEYVVRLRIVDNTLVGNDVGVYLSNLDESCNSPLERTNNEVVRNRIRYDAVNNTTGYNGTDPYQAGVSDQGNHDSIVNNSISGDGYKPCSPGVCLQIDVSGAIDAHVHVRRVR